MADLRRSRHGVNVLVTTFDRHQANGWTHDVDVQVDYRDPQGRTQTNPHVFSARYRTRDGNLAHDTGYTYRESEMNAIRQAAGERGTYPLRQANGQQLGYIFAVKADLIAVSPQDGPSGYRLNTASLRPSDFGADMRTREAQFANMRWARGPGAREVIADRGEAMYLRERNAQSIDSLPHARGAYGLPMATEQAQFDTTLTGRDLVVGTARPVRLETAAQREQRTRTQLDLMPDRRHSGPVPSASVAGVARHEDHRTDSSVLSHTALGTAGVKQDAASSKGVVASAVNGTAMGIARGVRTEMTNKEQRSADGAPSSSTGLPRQLHGGVDPADRFGPAMAAPMPQQAQKGPHSGKRPLSQRYNYQFEPPGQPDTSEPQYSG